MPENVLQKVGSHQVDKDGDVPRYQQVRDIIYRLVQSGQYQPGDRIPAELQLADLLGVSKMTVNKAVLSLAADGLLIREVGRGTFVAASAAPLAPSLHPKSAEIEPTSRKIALSFVEGAQDVLDSAYYGGIYRGVASLLEERGESIDLALSTAVVEYRTEDERNAVDGRLLFAPRADSIPMIEYLWHQRRTPLVVVGASWPSLNAPALDSDNVGGAFAAVRYLVEWGHRRIALLLAEPESANTQDRISGYRRALAVSGITPTPEYEVEAASSWKSGPTAEKRLVQLMNDEEEPVTAIFAAGHCLALEALNAARLAGKRAPQEVSVIGYDDTAASALVHPALTVMRQPLFEMGRRAAERLLRQMNDPDAERITPVVRELLPAELIVRASVAPAPRIRKIPQFLLEEGIGGA